MKEIILGYIRCIANFITNSDLEAANVVYLSMLAIHITSLIPLMIRYISDDKNSFDNIYLGTIFKINTQSKRIIFSVILMLPSLFSQIYFDKDTQRGYPYVFGFLVNLLCAIALGLLVVQTIFVFCIYNRTSLFKQEELSKKILFLFNNKKQKVEKNQLPAVWTEINKNISEYNSQQRKLVTSDKEIKFNEIFHKKDKQYLLYKVRLKPIKKKLGLYLPIDCGLPINPYQTVALCDEKQKIKQAKRVLKRNLKFKESHLIEFELFLDFIFIQMIEKIKRNDIDTYPQLKVIMQIYKDISCSQLWWGKLFSLVHYYSLIQDEAISVNAKLNDARIWDEIKRINPYFLFSVTCKDNSVEFINAMINLCLNIKVLKFRDEDALNEGLVYYLLRYLEMLEQNNLVIDKLICGVAYKIMNNFLEMEENFSNKIFIEDYNCYEDFVQDILRQHSEKSYIIEGYLNIKSYYLIMISIIDSTILMDSSFLEPLKKIKSYLIYQDKLYPDKSNSKLHEIIQKRITDIENVTRLS